MKFIRLIGQYRSHRRSTCDFVAERGPFPARARPIRTTELRFGGSIRNVSFARRSIVIALIAVCTARDAAAQAAPPSDPAKADSIKSDSVHTVAPTIAGKHNILPVVESTVFLTLLNIYDRIFLADAMQDGKKVYSSTFASTWEHLRKQNWVHDQDPFNVNQFEHPYQGSMMYGFARSSELRWK